MNILVLCTGNSARSILLESILNTNGKGLVTAFSAGSQPTGKVHSQTLKLLKKYGHEVSDLRSKSWAEFALPDAPEMDVVITVCGSAANETCPVWPGAPVQVHWGIDDPARAAPENISMAFETAYDALKMRSQAFLALPFDDLTQAQLRISMEPIGQLG